MLSASALSPAAMSRGVRLSSPARSIMLAVSSRHVVPIRHASNSSSKSSSPAPPLSVLPLSSVLRSLATATVTSSPLMLRPSLAVMNTLANSRSALLDPDRNPLLRAVLKSTFYTQFCAGETPTEVRRTAADLKAMGYSGVILCYAREVVLSEDEANSLSTDREDDGAQREIDSWAAGTLQTVELADAGDFASIKLTGAGRQALRHLTERLPPPPALAAALDRICAAAAARGVRLLFDAEQQAVQPGIDDWTLACMRAHNTPTAALIYGTYQAYLKAAPATLSRHLAEARRGGFALGIKLVRGAYLGSDPRDRIHDTKADTDRAYDALADAVLRQAWHAPLTPPPLDAADAASAGFPAVSLILACHNAESVRRARATMAAAGAAKTTDVAFAQLQGMADEISCALIVGGTEKAAPGRVQAYKYLAWGSAGECVKYLLRRAQENKDAVQRTRHTRDAMLWELVRRVRGLGRA